jgi:hypothetical protein
MLIGLKDLNGSIPQISDVQVLRRKDNAAPRLDNRATTFYYLEFRNRNEPAAIPAVSLPSCPWANPA